MKKISWAPLLLFVLSLLTAGLSLGQQKCDGLGGTDYPKYKLAKATYTAGDQSPRTLLMYMSVKPQALNRDGMLAVSSRIKRDFCLENRIQVVFFDQYKIAKRFVPHPHSLTYEADMKSIKGGYFLDRTTGEEYVSFIPIGSSLNQEQKIIISPKNPG